MKIHELKLSSTPDRKRVGRGIGSGYGKTAGRGTKGQNARTGGGVRPGFAGGQNPLAKQLPKLRGFRALNPTTYQVTNLDALDALPTGTPIDSVVLAEAGLIKYPDRSVKILGSGEIKHAVSLKVHAISKSAKAAIEAAGGTVEVLPLPKFPGKKATRPVVEPKSAV